MAGSASTNPMLLILGIVLILAWKVGGWYGLDRYLLPILGTPWTWRSEQSTTKPPTPPPTPQPTPTA
jgi:thiosulfate dehydrogenase (quinone) large subunit